ncbi:phasin protein [Luteibacter rhizovicinus]|uniref:Phasin protein n=1 Tax=Luteibacter rhizovicinus TaxID=242606 RepID=A0A4R3YUR0_9GAMM|nr:phasin family protein [Luteibacter rhizovicinus]TCV96290.1 phasin protein [Luteibacter rhizovicinus]
MTPFADHRSFAHFVEQATAAQAVAWRGFERVADLQMQAMENQARSVAGLFADAMVAQDATALRAIWEKGEGCQRDNAARATTTAGEILDVARQTANTLTAMVTPAGND